MCGVEQLRCGFDQSTAQVLVFDLDGVLRTFAHRVTAAIETRWGLPSGAWQQAAFDLPVAQEMIIGRATFADWVEAVTAYWVQQGFAHPEVHQAVTEWVVYRGTPNTALVAFYDDLVAREVPVFVFTNGTDFVPKELHQIGLGRLVGDQLINTADLGVAKPQRAAFEKAEDHIRAQLAVTHPHIEVRPDTVFFVDDSGKNVHAAKQHGWQAHHHRG